MKTKIASTAILLVLLTLASTQLVVAQSATVGVNSGDTFDYSYKINWSSTDPSATVPALYEELNSTQFIRISIIDVTGSLVNIDFTRHFNNGTEQTQNGNIDVNSQILEIPYSVLIIRAGGNSGEKIYPSGGHSMLTGTETKTYPFGQIQTVKHSSEDTSGSDLQRTEIIYDQANGVALEYSAENQESTGSYVTTTKETLMLTSGVIPEFPTAAILMLLLIAIPIVVIALRKKVALNDTLTSTLKK
jgi:hypothetical protein